LDEKKVLDAVKKLLALNVSEEEIISNLKEVGLNEKNALTIIRKAKGMPLSQEKKEVEEDSGAVLRQVAESLAESLGEEEKEEKKEEIEETTEKATLEEEFKKMKEKSEEKTEKEEKKEKELPEIKIEKPVKGINLTKLWEKGIITTVNQNLEEMKKIKTEIEKVIEEKTAKAVEKEKERIRILLDSQRALLIDKVNSTLKEKEAELMQTIDLKIQELKGINEEIKGNLTEIIGIEERNKALMAELEEKKAELNELKRKLVSEMTAEILKGKSEAKEFLEKAKIELSEIDDRVNKTLALESKIAEGILTDAKEKIDSLALEKSEEIERELKNRIKELEELKKKFDVKEIEKAINKFKEESSKLSLSGSTNLQEIQTLKEELNLAKDQFLNIIEKKVSEFNNQIKKMNETIALLEKQSNEKLALVDKKIAELNAFEENFAKEMGLIVDELIKQKQK